MAFVGPRRPGMLHATGAGAGPVVADPSPLSQSSRVVQWSYRLLKVEMFEEKLGPAEEVDLAKPSS